jgi:hypothetical protein
MIRLRRFATVALACALTLALTGCDDDFDFYVTKILSN